MRLAAASLAATLLAAAALAPSAAHAQVIVDVASGGAASEGPGINLAGFGPTAVTGANGFALTAPATVYAVSFYTQECCTLPWSGTLHYTFFDPSAPGSSTPGTAPFAQGTVTDYLATTVYSDPATNLVRRIDFNLTAPLALGTGRFFLGIAATSAPGSGPLGWRTVQGSGTSVATFGTDYGSWMLQSGEAAFQLHGSPFAITTTPEPSTAALLGGGLALLAGIAARRRRAAA